jgi:pyridoxal phosphate enzyme (YggS family)
MEMATISQSLQRVRTTMAEAALRAGRRAEDVALVAVTKYRSLAEIDELIAAGQSVMGENRVQELTQKIEHYAAEAIEWHLIGHLQTNKVKKVVGRCALIHGVESLRLAEALQREAERTGTTVNILLQVNVSGEESKFGLSPDKLAGIVQGLRAYDLVRCRGLMTMAPWEAEAEETRPVFRGLREMRDHLRDEAHEHLDLHHLSMGMTNDFEVAIEEGATLVRVGTALFEAT